MTMGQGGADPMAAAAALGEGTEDGPDKGDGSLAEPDADNDSVLYEEAQLDPSESAGTATDETGGADSPPPR